MWNKFLLSPLEFARYVDEFASPWIRAYFDIGNVAIQGYPQDWIRTLGKRIVKLHFKDFSFKKSVAEFTPLLEGAIDWRAVHDALADIGFQGTGTVELSGGDLAYLKEVNARFEKILAGSGLNILRRLLRRTCIRRVRAAGSESACSGSRIRAASGPASSS